MRRRFWLVAAVVLFALAAAFMLYGQDDGGQETPEVEVELPRRMRETEKQRLQGRRTLPALPPTEEGQPPPRPRDPLLAALPQGRGRTAVVLEANALRHSPVGELLLTCVNGRGRRGLDEVKAKAGVDPLQDFDRIVVTPDGMMVSGHFGEARWDELFRDGHRQSYGEKGQIFEQPPRRNVLPNGQTRESRRAVLGVWDNQLVVFGEDAAQVKQALDRVEGRAEGGDPVIREEQTFGEIYGVLSTDDLLRIVPDVQPQLVEQFRRAGAQMELHVDARSDVGVVARVTGTDAQQLEDLGKTLGGALALGRLQAQQQGDERLASLLELARVDPRGDSFNLELALPLAFLEKQLAGCRESVDGGDSENGSAASGDP